MAQTSSQPPAEWRGASFGIFVAFVCFGAAASMLLLPTEGPPAWREEVSVDALDGATRRARATRTSVERWLPVLDPSGGLSSYVRLSAEQPEGGLEVRLEADGSWQRVGWHVPIPVTAPVDRERPLQGVRILLDPGHRGGAWSEAEDRHFSLGDGPIVREGDLNWAVGRLTAEGLRAFGAQVELTRGSPPSRPPPGDPGPGFDALAETSIWLGRNLDDSAAQLWLGLFPTRLGRIGLERYKENLVQTRFFELHGGWDLRRRAEAAKDWQADVTLSLHHNMAMRRELNKLIFFVPGNILPDELGTVSERFYAVRRLLENDFDDALSLGRAISREMHKELRMPAPPRFRTPKEGAPNKIPVDERAGVYARNLAILKRTPGLVLLLEGPCMNNDREYVRLADRSVEVDGAMYPARVREYADAVVAALVEQASLLQRRRALREQGL